MKYAAGLLTRGALVLSLLALFSSCKKNSRDFNVIFISMDTTRADYIDTGAGARAYTPRIEKFAKKSVVFDRAFSTIPQTLPSHLSIFSSYLPHELGVLGNDYLYGGAFRMIQQVLQDTGYYTSAIISLGTLASSTGFNRGFDDFYEDLFPDNKFFVPAEDIVHRAFQVIETRPKNKNFFLFLHFSDPHSPYAPPAVHSSFKILIDGKLDSEFNAYHGAILRSRATLKKGVHTIDFKLEGPMDDFRFFIIRRLELGAGCSLSLHNLTFSEQHYGGSYLLQKSQGSITVHCPGEREMELFQVIPILSPYAAVNYYRQEVEYMDRNIGNFLHYLESSGLLKKTLVVLFADHGEGLGERRDYYGHTRYLNQQFIHVPLILHVPDLKSRHILAPVSLASLSPTILDFLGIRDDQFHPAKSLLNLMKSGKRKYKDFPVYSFTFAPDAVNDKLSVINWPYQGIFYLNGDILTEKEIYNLSMSQSYNHKDALFREVVKQNSIFHYRTFLKEYVQLKKAFSRGGAKKILADNQTLDRLNALGYIRNSN